MKFGIGIRRQGVALLFTIGILGLISLIGISFAINMLLTRKEAKNFLNSVKARYIAEAGIKKVIMDFRDQVASSSYDNLKTYIAAYGTNFTFGEGNYTLAITSEEGKVNLNTFDETDASQITILESFLTDQQIANIIDYRDTDGNNTTIGAATGNIEGTAQCKDKPFDSINEIRIATGISQATLDAGIFPNRNRDKITVYKPIIRGGLLGKYYRNITGTSPNVVIDTSPAGFAKKVVELGPVYQTPNDTQLPGTDGYEPSPPDIGWAETHDAEMAGASSVAPAGDFGIETFGVIWDGYLDIRSGEEGSAITFSVTVDDGARLFIDGTSILPAGSWQDQGQAIYTGTYTFQTPGWHKIRLEYYDNTYGNTVHLKWNLNPSLVVIPADRLGYDPPTEVVGGYNSAGIYTITSTASVVASGQNIATKQVTAVAEIFDTWTQTTKEEFYAAWFSQQDNFADGEVFNVNWLDSCPTDEDYWDAGTGKMHWEGNYTKIVDSVKLGYWDNFDEDPAFSAVMMKGYVWNRGWWGLFPIGSDTLNISYQDFQDSGGSQGNEIYLRNNTFESKHFELNRYYYRPDTQSVFVRAYTREPAPSSRIAWRGYGTEYAGPLPPLMLSASYRGAGWKFIFYYDGNGDGLLNYDMNNYPYQIYAPDFQIFPVYRRIDGMPTYIINPNRPYAWQLESIPAPGSYDYWQPEAPFCGCWIFAKGNADDTTPGWTAGATTHPNGFKTFLTDSDTSTLIEPRPLWPDNDRSEIRMGQNAPFWPFFDYLSDKVMSMIGQDDGATSATSAQYAAWINGALSNNQATWADWTYAYGTHAQVNFAQNPSPDPKPIFKFVANNQYLGSDWLTFDRGQHVIGGENWHYAGAVTMMDTYWDDIRCMAASGYIVSASFYTGSSPIKWGTISWTGQAPGNTAIEIYERTAADKGSIPTTDSGWASAAGSGAAIGGSSPWLQYKAVLSTTAIDRNNYQTSSRTPVLEDVTVTYLPVIQIKYWKEGL